MTIVGKIGQTDRTIKFWREIMVCQKEALVSIKNKIITVRLKYILH